MLLSNLVNYFMPVNDTGYFERQKAKALIVLGFISVFIGSLTVIVELLADTSQKEFMIIPAVFLSIFSVLILFLLRKTNIKITGNVYSLVVVLTVLASTNIIEPGGVIHYKYMGGFYTILSMLAVVALFGGKRMLVFSALLVAISDYRIYKYSIINFSAQTDLFTSAFVIHYVALVLMTISLFFIIRFTEKAVGRANSEYEKSEEKNKVLTRIIDVIKKGAEEVTQTSNVLSQSSSELSTKANEQASSLEEISVLVEGIFQTTQDNANFAKNTEEIVVKTTTELEKSSGLFLKALSDMEKVLYKMNVITEIVDKTDLLSINAGIEAAKAGEYGKGFGVIANEIRRLSEKTKIESNEIIGLSNSVQFVMQDAKKRLLDIIPQVVAATQKIRKITEEAINQKNKIEEINASLENLGAIASSHSSMAEELTVTSEELFAQAQALKEISLKDIEISDEK